jgi:hypothetical protein
MMMRRGVYAATVAVAISAAIAVAGIMAATAHAKPAHPAALTWHSYRVPAVAKSWVTKKLPKGDYMGIVSCAGASFCVATGGDKRGQAMLMSTDPTSGSSWTLTPLPIGSTTLTGLQCRSRSFCVAVGRGGLVMVGRR